MRLLFLVGISAGSAQVLTHGTSQLPSCAQSCQLLNQAVDACGGQSASTPGIWSCFCQSAYLRTLYTSPNGICDATCTNPSDNEQVMTWYKAQCGTDNGQSEHSNSGDSDTSPQTTTSSSAAAATTATGGSDLPTTTASGGYVGSVNKSESGSWFGNHWKWIVMLIAILVGAVALALILTWLKRHRRRKQDAISSGFNAGITHRTVKTDPETHLAPPPMAMASGGRDSPARTREAFMPYGYGYSRSESRVASHTNVAGDASNRGSMLRGETPVAELEKGAHVGGEKQSSNRDSLGSQQPKRVQIQERSVSQLTENDRA